MKISVIGLGYVGAVSAACLARRGHEVVGVDVNPRKVSSINDGVAPVLEPGLPEATAQAVESGRLRATLDAAEAVRATEVSLICVGTPSGSQGSLSLAALERVCADIGAALPTAQRRHTVVVRSTVLPGTSEGTMIPALEASSGLVAGRDFGFAVNPEYLREGSGVADFDDPEKTVIGELDPRSGDPIAEIYGDLAKTTFRVPIRVAEAAKYIDNAFHALKVGFANEVGALSVEFGIDSHQLMRIFKADRKLNISDAYLNPGFCFGGSCLPKDLRALVHRAQGSHVAVPILESVLESNEAHFRRTYELLTANGRRRIGLLGLAFKPGTDELRESPLRRARRAADRQGLRPSHLRPVDPPAEPHGHQPRVHRGAPAAPEAAARRDRRRGRRARRDLRRRIARRRGRTGARRRQRPDDRRPRPPPASL